MIKLVSLEIHQLIYRNCQIIVQLIDVIVLKEDKNRILYQEKIYQSIKMLIFDMNLSTKYLDFCIIY